MLFNRIFIALDKSVPIHYNMPMNTIGLYIHVPFCVRKCGYCDFYSVTEQSLIDDYVRAVIRNIKAYNCRFDTVYFGGGTPSLLSAEQIKQIIDTANPVKGAEITLECNPGTADSRYFSDIRQSGVNRLSIGVQSLDNAVLQKLGRIHDRAAAIAAIASASAVFDNVSVDLMLGVSANRRVTDDIADLMSISGNHIKHISAYILKIEENTPFAQIPASDFPDENHVCDSYLDMVNTLEQNGYEQYEISNFSIPGYESKHNRRYWECKEYLGIGPTAHSYLNDKRFAVPRDINAFIKCDRQPVYITDESPGTAEERLLLSMRLMKRGVDVTDFPQIIKKAEAFVDSGLMKLQGNTLTLTPKGALVSNSIIAGLM
jgi:oxygen-independent coproporphyrinogen-3 oxidase